MGGIGGKPAEVLPPVGAARLSGGAARADSERRKSAVDFSLSERVQAVVRDADPVTTCPVALARTTQAWPWLRSVRSARQDAVCSSALTSPRLQARFQAPARGRICTATEMPCRRHDAARMALAKQHAGRRRS